MTRPLIPSGSPAGSDNLARRVVAMPLTLVEQPLPVLFEDDNTGIFSQTINSGANASITGVSVTITPPPGTTYIVYATAHAILNASADTSFNFELISGSSSVSLAAGSLPANADDTQRTVPLNYVGSITAATTYTLKVTNGGAGALDVFLGHLSVMAVPQSRVYSHPADQWEVPFRGEIGAREVIRKVRLLRSGGPLGPNTANHYKIRAGIRNKDGVDWIAQFDGKTDGLAVGKPLPIHGGGEIEKRVRVGDSVVTQITRIGRPAPLEGTTIEYEIEMVGD